MADTKISALTQVVTPASTDEFAVNQGGTSKKMTLAQVMASGVVTGDPKVPTASFTVPDGWEMDTIGRFTLGGTVRATLQGASDFFLFNPPVVYQPPALVVAASNARYDVRASADYVCDGNNDAAQIMAAINSLPPSGGTILLSSGTFFLTAQGTKTDDSLSQTYCILLDELDGPVAIVGQGMDNTTLRLANGQAAQTIPLLVRGTDAVQRTSPTLLTQFTIDGNASNNTGWGDFGILEIAYAQQVTTDIVKLTNAPYFLLQSFRKSTDIRFARCWFLNANVNNEVRIEHENFVFTQCRFEAPEGASSGGTLSLTVNDDIGDFAARNGRVFANLFIGGFVPIAMTGASGCIITDNEILMGATAQDTAEGIRMSHWVALLSMDSEHNIIANNRIEGAGTGIRLAGESTYGSKYNTVAHNVIENDNNNLFWGIRESDAGSDNNLILDNQILETFFVSDIEYVGASTVVRRPDDAPVFGYAKTPSRSFTLKTNRAFDIIGHWTLASTVRATLQGNADIILSDDFGVRGRITLAGRGL